MNSWELSNKLHQLSIEDFIWIVYVGIIILSWYSNFLERDYFLNHNYRSKEKYRKSLIIIFLILNIVYYYFFMDSKRSFDQLKVNDSQKKKDLTHLSYVASSFILISGIIFLYIAFTDDDLNVELAFN